MGWWMDNELEMVWKEAVLAYYKVLSWNFPGGAEKKYEEPQLGEPVFGPRFESGTFWILCRSDNYSILTLELLLLSC